MLTRRARSLVSTSRLALTALCGVARIVESPVIRATTLKTCGSANATLRKPEINNEQCIRREATTARARRRHVVADDGRMDALRPEGRDVRTPNSERARVPPLRTAHRCLLLCSGQRRVTLMSDHDLMTLIWILIGVVFVTSIVIIASSKKP